MKTFHQNRQSQSDSKSAMVPYILYFSVLVAVVNCGAIDRIIGGYPLNIADAPYQVAILASDKMLCSGAILTEKHVLTAAYCVA